MKVVCRSLTRFEGTASCEVAYTIIPDSESYTERSDGVGGAEDVISVLLTTTTGPGISVAAATRGGKQDVTLEGTFQTGLLCQYMAYTTMCILLR